MIRATRKVASAPVHVCFFRLRAFKNADVAHEWDDVYDKFVRTYQWSIMRMSLRSEPQPADTDLYHLQYCVFSIERSFRDNHT